MPLARLIFAVLLLSAFFAPPAAAERRIALVIGEDAYERLPADRQLRNAVNDARAVKDALEQLGFAVTLKENLRRADLVDALSDFSARLGKDDIAFFFYAGHGVALNGANYLLPTDIAPPRGAGRDEEARLEEARLIDSALAESRIIERIKGAGARVAVVVLDACRDNPFAQPGLRRTIGGSRGLAEPPQAEGIMSIYSAGVGQSAWDSLNEADSAKNSLFTRVFVEVLKTPGLDLQGVARETRRRVSQLARSAGKTQTPGYYEQIDGEVFLAGREGGGPKPEETQMAEFSAAMSAGSVAALSRYLSKYPTGPLAETARREKDRLGKIAEAHKRPTLRAPGGGVVRTMIVGINDYYRMPQNEQLLAAVADAQDIAQALTRAGVEATPILDREATRPRIVQELNRLVADARAGDLVIISFAGHGLQVLEYEAFKGLDPEGVNEQIALSGFAMSGEGVSDVLVNRELKAYLARLDAKGVDVLVAMDSSFGGGMSRSVSLRDDVWTTRRASGTISKADHDKFVPIPMVGSEARAVVRAMTHVTFLAGATKDTVAPEIPNVDPRGPRGALSYFIARAIEGRMPAREVTREALIKYILQNVSQSSEGRQLIDFEPRTNDPATLQSVVFRFE